MKIDLYVANKLFLLFKKMPKFIVYKKSKHIQCIEHRALYCIACFAEESSYFSKCSPEDKAYMARRMQIIGLSKKENDS